MVDAYKKCELEDKSKIGIFSLSAIIVDKAEPSEALKANTVWSSEIENTKHLLSSLQLNDFRLALADQGVNEHTYAKLAKHYLQKYSKEVSDKKGFNLTEKNIEKFITELPLSKYLKQEFGLKPKKWVMWSAGSLSKGGLNFSVGQLGRKNESNGFTVGADLDWTDNSLLGFALRDETEDVTISVDGTKFKSDNSTLSFYNTWKADDKNYIDTFIGFGAVSYTHLTLPTKA